MGNVFRIFEKTRAFVDYYHKRYPEIAHIWNRINPSAHSEVINIENEFLMNLKRELIEYAEDYVALEYILKMLERELNRSGNEGYRVAISNAIEEISKKQNEIYNEMKDKAVKYYWVSNFGYKAHQTSNIEIIALFFIGFVLAWLKNKLAQHSF